LRRSNKLKQPKSLATVSSVELKSFVSASATVIALWILFDRFISEYLGAQSETSLLKAFAKCPGLPFGAYSKGPDYIDISIDAGLAVVAAVFIALTIRDIRRKRRADLAKGEDAKDQESDDL
jgi:hypothetical protein